MAQDGFAKDYAEKLTSPAEAVRLARSGSNLSMGMALGEPPALLKALSDRVDAGDLTDIRLWYFHSMPAASQTLLRYELMDRVFPQCMFLGPTERPVLPLKAFGCGHELLTIL